MVAKWLPDETNWTDSVIIGLSLRSFVGSDMKVEAYSDAAR